jgi:hypothetical protein
MGWEHLAIGKEGRQEPASVSVRTKLRQVMWDGISLIFEADIITSQTPAMIRGIETVIERKNTPN